jgi:hypothetical protein
MRSLVAVTSLAIFSSFAPAQASESRPRDVGPAKHSGVATLKEELKIGSVDGAEEYLLGSVSDIAIAADGTIYAYDSQVPVIRVYDANGKFLRNIGRKGQGPGEFGASSGLAIARDGRVLHWDTGNWRINVFSASGASLTSWPLVGSGTSSSSGGLIVDAAGSIHARQVVFGARGTPSATQWVRMNSSGTARDTLRLPATVASLPPLQARALQSSSTVLVPYASSIVHTLSPTGNVVVTNSGRYEVEIQRDGKSIARFARAVPAAGVSSAERGTARKWVETRLRQTDPNWSWSGPDIPDTKPFFGTPIIALDGRIWLVHGTHLSEMYVETPGNNGVGGGSVGRGGSPPPQNETPSSQQKPKRYDVFEPDGTFLGQVELPGGVSPRVSRGDLLWDDVVGDDDVLYLKRFRIMWR